MSRAAVVEIRVVHDDPRKTSDKLCGTVTQDVIAFALHKVTIVTVVLECMSLSIKVSSRTSPCALLDSVLTRLIITVTVSGSGRPASFF
jgi:hypothetical protein